MKKNLRSFLYFFLEAINFKLFHKGTSLRVLAYHTVPDKKQFEKHINYLRANYDIVSIEQLQDSLTGRKNLSANSVLITFDDGDRSVLENGLPVLKKYNLPSVLFVITGLIDTSRPFWWKRVERAFELEGLSYSEARAKVNFLKQVMNKEREAFLSTLTEEKFNQLTSAELLKMNQQGMFVANHTHSHPMINKCTGEEIEKELNLSRSKFQEWNLNGFPVFAYPNGNWDSRTEEVLRENGIEIAFLFDHKINKGSINPMRISRIRMDADTEMKEFKVKVSGLHSGVMNLKELIMKE